MRSQSSMLCILGAVAAVSACAAENDSEESRSTVEESPPVVYEPPAVVRAPPAIAQASGCRTGGNALANAYVRANPLYAYFVGSLESYVADNAEHFRADGDAIRCATALSQVLLHRAVQLHDPIDQRRHAELRAQLKVMDIDPGPVEPTASGQAASLSVDLSYLARILPAVANGDYQPTTTLDSVRIVARQMVAALFRIPAIATFVAHLDPAIRELANLDYRAVERAAAALANSE